MKASYILAVITTIIGVIEAAPSTREEELRALIKRKRTESENIAAAESIFNKRTVCEAYPCDEDPDCKVLGCRGGCHENENDLLRCNS